jgi:3D (Asp-Asp-Asp) domain-containing protein
MKRNWIFIAILCFFPYNLITSASDAKKFVIHTEKKVEKEIVDEFKKIVTLTTYSTTEGETDDSPNITASGFEIDEDNPKKHRIIAVSRDLKRKLRFGEKVVLSNAGKFNGVWYVRDLMNSRFKNKIDVLINQNERHTKLHKVIIKKLD